MHTRNVTEGASAMVGPFLQRAITLWRNRGASGDHGILLNSALDLALDFDNGLAPVHSRLRERHASLDAPELERLYRTCMDAILFGQQAALELVVGGNVAAARKCFEERLSRRYPWVSASNLERAWRYCIHYATKTARTGLP